MYISRIALLLVLALPVLFSAGCPTRQTLKPAGPTRTVVEAFLHAMIADDEELQAMMISPAWQTENGIDLDAGDYNINGYIPTGYVITDVTDEIATVLIQFDDGGAHQLRFRIRIEDGQDYIVPGSVDEGDDWFEPGWINPWLDVIENVR